MSVLRKTLVVKAAQVCAQDIIRSRLININNNKSFSNSAKFKYGLIALLRYLNNAPTEFSSQGNGWV